ncbi:hypothetical protein N8D56_22090 [Devosia sp. A8/3-2]|nr:hypothetical protein N8D56_22090 [Devosia sp. A8/3-2]
MKSLAKHREIWLGSAIVAVIILVTLRFPLLPAGEPADNFQRHIHPDDAGPRPDGGDPDPLD